MYIKEETKWQLDTLVIKLQKQIVEIEMRLDSKNPDNDILWYNNQSTTSDTLVMVIDMINKEYGTKYISIRDVLRNHYAKPCEKSE